MNITISEQACKKINHTGHFMQEKEELVSSALRWWRSKRPIGMNMREHISNPIVNIEDMYDRNLANAVAIFVAKDCEDSCK